MKFLTRTIGVLLLLQFSAFADADKAGVYCFNDDYSTLLKVSFNENDGILDWSESSKAYVQSSYKKSSRVRLDTAAVELSRSMDMNAAGIMSERYIISSPIFSDITIQARDFRDEGTFKLKLALKGESKDIFDSIGKSKKTNMECRVSLGEEDLTAIQLGY